MAEIWIIHKPQEIKTVEGEQSPHPSLPWCSCHSTVVYLETWLWDCLPATDTKKMFYILIIIFSFHIEMCSNVSVAANPFGFMITCWHFFFTPRQNGLEIQVRIHFIPTCYGGMVSVYDWPHMCRGWVRLPVPTVTADLCHQWEANHASRKERS